MRNIRRSADRSVQAGFTMLELIATMAMVAVISLMAANNLKRFDDPVQNAAAEMIGFFKQVRARAIATTSAYRIVPSDSGTLQTEYSNNCSSETSTADNQLMLAFPNGANLVSTDWEVCVNSRGFPDSNTLISVTGESGTRFVEIYLGGAIKEVES